MASVLQSPLAVLLFQHPAEPGASLPLLGVPWCAQVVGLSLPTMACSWMSLALGEFHGVGVPPCQIHWRGVTFI